MAAISTPYGLSRQSGKLISCQVRTLDSLTLKFTRNLLHIWHRWGQPCGVGKSKHDIFLSDRLFD